MTEKGFRRAYTAAEIVAKRMPALDIAAQDEALADLLGAPLRSGVWFCWGNSGNGKTEFLMRLLRLFSATETTLYLSLEEGVGNMHLKEALRRNGLASSKKLLVAFDTIEELTARLRRNRSPRIVLIDTVQYWGVSYDQYRALVDEFQKCLFVFMSHVDAGGRVPDGSTAQRIKRDSDMRLWVEGFKAFNRGRTWGRTNEYVIWSQGAEAYWGKKNEGGEKDEQGTENTMAQEDAHDGMGPDVE